MRVFEVRDSFGLAHLRPAERPQPSPGFGQVLLRVEAISLNYRDLMMVDGRYNPRQPLPLIPCSDGVGTVEAVGEGVNRCRKGDRVAALFSQGWIAGRPQRSVVRKTLGGPLDGTLCEWIVLDQEGVSPVPESWSAVEAATLPCAGLTAWSALFTLGNLQPGETVLVQGTGGVALLALQLAQLAGAQVICTSSSEEKLRRVEDLGAWRTINYLREPLWGKAAKAMTGGHGVDLLIEVGGAGTLEQSCAAMAMGGTIASIGVLAGNAASLQMTSIFMQQIRLQGVLVGSRAGFEALTRALGTSTIRPVIDRVFPFDEAREAFAYLASGSHFGKICIELDP